MMVTATLREFQRRLQVEGYSAGIDELGAGPVCDGERNVYVWDDGEIQCKPENRDLAYRVKVIRDEVEEYMSAFIAAVPEQRKSGVTSDTRTLLRFRGCEMAGRRSRDGMVDFITWELPRGQRELGHYFVSYAAAKQDFAVRAGLIDRDRLFTETELRVIRSNLSDYLAIDEGASIPYESEQAIRGVIKKIDNTVVPEIEEQAQEAEDQGFEPEYEM